MPSRQLPPPRPLGRRAAPRPLGAAIAGVWRAAVCAPLALLALGASASRGSSSVGVSSGRFTTATDAALTMSALDTSYSMLTTKGAVLGFGAALSGSTPSAPNAPMVGMAATPDGRGTWAEGSDGGIFTFGDAAFFGSMGGKPLNKPIVGMGATPDGKGYWEVASDGGIFTFGDAAFYGSMGGKTLVRPIVGFAATPDGKGYWEAASDGGIFTFGDASYFGSAAGSGQQVVGVVPELGGYQNPLRAVNGLTPERIDQGVDYAGAGPVYALGDGVVLNTTNAGWPGGAFISYQLSDGPAAGDIVYVAENLTPEVQVGQRVTSNTVIGNLIDAYPDMETGWADPPGTGQSLASAAGQWSSYDDSNSIPTAYGENYSQLLAALGAPGGLSHAPAQGSLPAGWPTW